MGIVRRQGILITLTMYAGVAIGYISWGLILPNYLAPASLGLVITIRDVSIFFSRLSQGGMMPSTVRFFPYFKGTKDKLNSYHTFSMLYAMIGFVLFSIILILFEDKILSFYTVKAPEIVKYFHFIFPLIFFYVVIDFLGVFFISLKDYVTYSIFKSVFIRIIILALVGCFLHFKFDLNNFIKLFIIAHYLILVGLLILFYTKHKLGFSLSHFKEIVEVGFIKFASFNYMNGFISYTVRYIDGLMIVAYLGVGSAGIYGVGFLMASVIEMPRAALNSIISPLIASHWKENEVDKIAELHKKASLNQLIIGLLLFVSIVVNLDDIFSLIKPEYAGGITIVILIGLSKLINMSTGVSLEIITNSKYYKFNTVNAILKFGLVVGTNVILIPTYGIKGAAFATLISIIGCELILMAFIYIKINIQPFSKKTIKVVLFGLTPLMLNYYVDVDFGIFLNIPIKMVIITLIYVLPIYLLKLSLDLNTVFNGFIKIIRK